MQLVYQPLGFEATVVARVRVNDRMFLGLWPAQPGTCPSQNIQRQVANGGDRGAADLPVRWLIAHPPGREQSCAGPSVIANRGPSGIVAHKFLGAVEPV